MKNITEKIDQASAGEIGALLEAVLKRSRALFPDWEISILSLEKQKDRNLQIDETIRLLEAMKTKE